MGSASYFLPEVMLLARLRSEILSDGYLLEVLPLVRERIDTLKANGVTPVGRTILDPSKLPFVSGHICISEYPVHILGAELKAKGLDWINISSCRPTVSNR